MTPDDVPSRFSFDLSGVTLLGIYRVEEKIADGGMGSVWLGEDTNLGRRVVVKVPHVRFLGEPGFRTRFKREIAELVRLEHPNIVRILAQGTHEEIPFFVLQYLGGGNLEARLESDGGGPRDIEAVIPWLRKIAATLDFVHGRGIVHRDVKPENILFDEEGHVFLSDFGVVKALDEDLKLTEAGTGVGSPKYMAPEQGLGRPVEGAADQYGLATSVYEVITGRLPFDGGSALEVLLNKQKEEPAHLTDLAPDLPTACADAVMRGLRPEPEDRFPSCQAFADAFLAGAGIFDRTPATGVPTLDEPAAPTTGHRLFAIGLTIVLLAAAALAVAFAAGFFSSEPEVVDDSVNDPYQVVLRDAGAEPRRRLRYRLTPGATERSVTRLKQQMSGNEEGQEPETMPVPATVTTVEFHIEEVTDTEIAFTWTYEELVAEPEEGLPEMAIEATNRMLELLKGARGKGRMSTRGVGRSNEITVEEGDNPFISGLIVQMKETMKHISTPLPREPVGQGARWEVTFVVDSMGMRLTQTITYELTKLEGDIAHLDVVFAYTAPSQDFKPSILNEDLGMRIRKAHGDGEGNVVLDLNRFIPITSAMSTEFTMEMEMGEGEEAKRARMISTANIEIRQE